MNRVVALFREFSKQRRCSGETAEAKAWLETFGKNCGYEVMSDESGNLLCRKGNPTLCLQSHYDMVCIGNTDSIEMVEEDGWLKAKGSTLGADNGIGVAAMLWMMEEGHEIECLFTNDEETGLIGASNITLQIKSPQLLNLDSEMEGEVFVGCAGGFDLTATLTLLREPGSSGYRFYRVETQGFPGGHSGVDIHQSIPNAIREVALWCLDQGASIVRFEGGERPNAIPRGVNVIVAFPEDKIPESTERISVTPVEEALPPVVESKRVAALLAGAPDGVLGWLEGYGVPSRSANVAMVRHEASKLTIILTGRAMDDTALAMLSKECRAHFLLGSDDVVIHNKYPAWKPEESAFSHEVAQMSRQIVGKGEKTVIHAGLECGILKKRLGNVDVASIGPTIRWPHSDREQVDIASVERFALLVKALVTRG